MALGATDHQKKLEAEARVFAGKHNDKVRSVAWGAIPYFQQKLRAKLDMGAEVQKLLNGRKNLKALTLACGDMKGEYNFFKRHGAGSIVAYDISEGQRQRCYDLVYDGEVALDYRIADVNEVEIEPDSYDLIYMQQSLHHLVEVEAVVARINAGLKSDGLFVLNDYVGAPFLQRGPKQREICGQIWKALPERLRVDQHGKVVDELFIPAKEMLSPFEAIRSDAILPSLAASLRTHVEIRFGGVMFPIVNGFAPCYNPGQEPDDTVIRMLWRLDEALGAAGAVEPTFLRGIYLKKLG